MWRENEKKNKWREKYILSFYYLIEKKNKRKKNTIVSK